MKPVPEHLRPGIKPTTARCAPGRRLPNCTAPSDGHYCPTNGDRCIWEAKPLEESAPAPLSLDGLAAASACLADWNRRAVAGFRAAEVEAVAEDVVRAYLKRAGV